MIRSGFKPKPCKTCGADRHYTSFCPYKPHKKLSHGPVYRRWSAFKTEWFKLYGYDHSCHYCGIKLDKKTITLDHKISRSRAPKLRYDFDNIVPCCFWDNNRKGSLDHDEYDHICKDI